MIVSSFKTPLIAAFFMLGLLAACSNDNKSNHVAVQACNAPTTAIALIQGSAPQSRMVGQNVSVRGVVTLIEPGQGIYVEEPASDNDLKTSNAIFLEAANLAPEIKQGALIVASGIVTELEKGRNSLTALHNIETIDFCAGDQHLPLSSTDLPLNGLGREAVEGMRIALPQTLTVTDNYRLNKGQISLSGNGFQYVATEVVQPGDAAGDYNRENQSYVMPIQLKVSSTASNAMQAGATIKGLTGVMTHDDRSLRLHVTAMTLDTANPPVWANQTVPEPAADNQLRVVSMNLHNYFNGDGQGAGFPTPRGAKTRAEFDDQRQRIGAALSVLKPDLIAVMEIENDGFDANSAAADFVALLEQEVGGKWQAARPEQDNTGSDAITVGLFYRQDVWQTSGATRTLSGPEFNRSRQPFAQIFQPKAGGEAFVMVVNHLKSKGSCPDAGPNADQKDGQSCWNPMRTAAAHKITAWVNSLASANQIDRVLIMGDMNAYRNEDPVNAIRAAGFEELWDDSASPTFTYMYYGEAGTLDYAFVSPSLRADVSQSFIWHINSTMPANMELPQPWMRYSDHDPVIVDLSIRH